MSGEQELRAAVQLAQTGMLTQRAARAIDYFSQHGVQCAALRGPDGQIGVAYRGRWYTPGAFNALFADIDGGTGDTSEASDTGDTGDTGDTSDTSGASDTGDEWQRAQAELTAAERELHDARASNDYAGTTGGRTSREAAARDQVRLARKAVRDLRRQREQREQRAQRRTPEEGADNEGAGAVVWAILALCVLAALAGAALLWTQAHGFPGH